MGWKRKRSWVSEARFKPYLDECEGDEQNGWRLYEWNARVSSVLSECIHHLEVLLRNAMVSELGKLHPLAYPWHGDNDTISRVAQKRKGSSTQSPTPDDVISGLNLGYWKQLLQDKPTDNEELWRNTLKDAFPNSSGDRKTVLHAVEDLFELRNRCAHQDSLLGFDLSVELKKIIKLATWIDRDAGYWIESIELVTDVVARRPVLPKTDTAVIGDSTDRAYETYKRVSALINPANRKIGPVTYLGFYHGKKIEPHFACVLDVVVPTVWSPSEAAQLKKSESDSDKQIGKIMSYALGQGYGSGENFEIYLLSPLNSSETLQTTSGLPIHHRKAGRGSAFVKGGMRYFSISSLTAASETSDLE